MKTVAKAKLMTDDEHHYEERDGKVFRVVRLPDVLPPAGHGRTPMMSKSESRASGISPYFRSTEACVNCKRRLPRTDMLALPLRARQRRNRFVCGPCREEAMTKLASDEVGLALWDLLDRMRQEAPDADRG